MNPKSDQYNIIAPICSVKQAIEVIKAGADEIYFGIMTDEWIEKYGNSDLISRRQSEFSHLTKVEDFTEIVKLVNDQNKKATLVLNSKYTERQIPYVLELLLEWELCGGHSVMVADIGILLWLNEQNSRLERHLSVLSGVFNSYSVGFFSKLNISRIVLPRELRILEIRQIIESCNNSIDFEIITMFQKCEFIDSFCNFYHAFNYHPFIVSNSHELLKNEKLPLIYSYDINYEGHGCDMIFFTEQNIQIKHLRNNEFLTPYCAACQLADFKKMGIFNYKIAGRGFPIDLIIKAIKFLRNSIDNTTHIKNNYKSIFGKSCDMEFCYYK